MPVDTGPIFPHASTSAVSQGGLALFSSQRCAAGRELDDITAPLGWTALALVASPPGGTGRMLPGFGLAMLVFIWAATAMLTMPMHGRLLAGSDPRAHRGVSVLCV